MQRNEILAEALTMIRAAGYQPSVTRGRHWKITWIDQYGRTRLLVISFSPSDRRERLNARATARRMLTS
jgi:hypothetical protein